MKKEDILAKLREATQKDQLVLSLHAAERAVEENISELEIKEALLNAELLENYANWWLGPCCLIYGQTSAKRPIHVVCSYEQLPITIITVYEPRPPKWITPKKRGKRK